MTGLDKILNEIREESEENANQILLNAQLQTDEIINKAKAVAAENVAQIKEKTKMLCKDILDRGNSAAQLYKRQTILSAKQELIDKTLKKAYQSLINLPDEQYFDLILKLIEKYALEEEGIIYFNNRDLKRMPIIFGTEIEKVAKGQLMIGEIPKNIESGFILSYGGIEENCTFRAIFDSQQELLQDKVNHLLFS